MIKITQRDLIKSVAIRWRNQYFDMPAEKSSIYAALLLLDKEKAAALDVKNIIGNDSWTALSCHECGQYVEEVMSLGQEPDYESHTANVCFPCLCKAMETFKPNHEGSVAADKDAS